MFAPSRNSCSGFWTRGLLLLAASGLCAAQGAWAAHPAADFRQPGQPVAAQADGALVAEFEEFRSDGQGWAAHAWGENYYAATLANTFLSRKAFLGAPSDCVGSTATIELNVPAAGRYAALVRYEAVYRFQTRFRLQIEQQGQLKLDRIYGDRANPKIWAFGNRVTPEVAWDWGAVENVVWEGHDALVDLAPGPAVVRLIAEAQTEPAAKRNVDVLVLTPHLDDVQKRIESESYLPLDGLLTQAGDVVARVLNQADGAALQLTFPQCTEHSPYWVHQRTWKPVTLAAQPGETTRWAEVGELLDTLNDSQWNLSAQPDAGLHYIVEIGLRGADGQVQTVGQFESRAPRLVLAVDGDFRYSRRIRPVQRVLYDLLDYLRQQPVAGKRPEQTLIYGYTFDHDPQDPAYNASVDEFRAMFNLQVATPPTGAGSGPPKGYIDLRGQTPEQLAATCQKLQADGIAQQIAVVSLGDEIGLPQPPADDAAFHAWLQAQGLQPGDVLTGAATWDAVHFQTDAAAKTSAPGVYYYSWRYVHAYGIAQQKLLTDVCLQYMPQAHVGANFSPHHGQPYLGSTYQWIQLFRAGGMTLPWGEDYIFQVPVGTQQMNSICLDLFRAGLRGRPQAKILYYVMPHWPGNRTDSWRRQFYGDLAHGMQIVDLFEFRPVQAAYTENHCSLNEMYAEVRRSFYELGQFEDLVQGAQVQPGVAALYFSEAADIWNDNSDPYAAAKRALYIAIRQQQLPLDFVIEEDALAGVLDQYKVLYVADRHVSRAATRAIAAWVERGGRLLATAGAGLRDEQDQPNVAFAELLGIAPQGVTEPAGREGNLRFLKQDLPFVAPLDSVQLSAAEVAAAEPLPVLCVRANFTPLAAQVVGTFADGAPAVARRTFPSSGSAVYCGFLPGLSYFQPAIPRLPPDRSSAADSLAHFIPTQFHAGAAALVGLPAREVGRPVECSEPLVESSLLVHPGGCVLPLVNWSAGPVPQLRVIVRASVPRGNVSLASGQPVQETAGEDGARVFTLDLDVADALIFR